MSKENNINLVEAISLLKEIQTNAMIAYRCYRKEKFIYKDEKAEKKAKAIETILNYIDNSIPKEVIEKKMIVDTDKLNHSTNGILSEMYKARIALAKELLEGK